MAVKYCRASIDVVQAAEIRIRNVFSNGLPVYMSFSGGKDSLCMAQVVVKLIQQGEIDPSQLICLFIDEEAIFPCVEKTVKEWRKKFLMLGARFNWYCLEVKHFNCFNDLSNDETFICWDHEKEDVWVRRPPVFAIRNHPKLRSRIDAYQDFIPRIVTDGMQLLGVRASESVQRLTMFSKMIRGGQRKLYPIYDWHNNDVWLYLLQEKVEIPDIYMYLWQSGVSKGRLRVSQFFSSDTARSLVKMNEYYPDLMDRITRREPNAYLAALYWDSEMFGRSTNKRKHLEEGQPEKDYKKELIHVFSHMEQFDTPHKRYIANCYRKFFLSVSAIVAPDDYKKMYEGLMSGDPKLRIHRGLYQKIYSAYIDTAKKEDMYGK